jgi:Ca-activated chloride channel family protein
MKINITFILLFLCAFSHAQNINSLIRKGNTAYYDSTFADAENLYREALQKNQNSFASSFNLADATYKQEKYSEASMQFEALAKRTENKIDKSKSYHNLGNSLFKEDKLDQSIEAYKNALKANPNDMETKYNLAFAQKMKKQNEQQEDEKKEDQKEEKEEEEKEEEKKEEEKDEQDQNSNSEEDKKEEPKEPQDPNEMTDEEAKQMLDALQQQEKELQEDLQKKKAKGTKIKIEKDW